ncbi:MAG: CrcB family protein [Nitriliruptor sp.]|uniref:CrcB family protein n=1 Tax=Nitriliruptor sp. TaxID=2448056 RepID=UPI00349FD6B8
MSGLVTLLGLAVAGAVGSVVRHATLARVGQPGTAPRAWAVAAVNLVGAVIVAAVALLQPPETIALVLTLGLAGSLTTFSTWVVDAVLAADAGRSLVRIGLIDLAGQLVVGTAIVFTVVQLA